MEDSLENIIKPKRVEHIFLYKQFEEVCPFFISIGMSYDQFWYEDVSITKYYFEAFKLKEKREAEKNKWARWEQGLYVYEAICNASPILRAFSKATKPLPYPQKPYGIDETETQKVDKEQKQKEIEKVQLLRTQIFFENWAKAASTKFKEKGEDSG